MGEARRGVTVVLAAHQLEAYLPACLDGLLEQTVQDFDVLFIDDASTDGTPAIARAVQSRLPGRFHVQSLAENTGMAALARNVALDSGMIRGDYVLFLDGDDGISPDFIARMMDAAREGDADMVVCAFDRHGEEGVDGQGAELARLPGGRRFDRDAGDLAYINTALWNKLIKREIIGDTRMMPLRVGEDALFLLTLYEKCERIAFVPEPLMHYRTHARSAMARTDMRDITRFGEALAALYEQSRAPAMTDTIALAALIHIGLSMACRAAANPGISLHAFTSWASALFAGRFNRFRGVRPLSARALVKRGRRGVGLWLTKWVYRLGLAPAMLLCMRLFPRRVSKWARW